MILTMVQLFFEFLKTGLFAIGGGLATLPFLYDISNRLGWYTHADVANMIAISESTPGAIGINMATYAGFMTTKEVFGGIIATLGLITPSIIIIVLIAKLLNKFQDNKYVTSSFYGLRPASIAMIASAGLSVIKITLLNLPAFEASGQILDLFVWKALLLGIILYIAQKKTKMASY